MVTQSSLGIVGTGVGIGTGGGGGGGGRVSFASDLQQISPPLSEMDHESGYRESESPPSPSPIMDGNFLHSITNESTQEINDHQISMNNYPQEQLGHPSHSHSFHHGHQSSYLLNPTSNQSPSPSSSLIHYLNNQTLDPFLPTDNGKDMISASSSTSSNIGSSSCTGSSLCGGMIGIGGGGTIGIGGGGMIGIGGSGQLPSNTILFPSVNPGLPFVTESSPILTPSSMNPQPGSNNGLTTLYFNDYSNVSVSN